jgi:RNA recognition motif-containing protein
MSAAPAVNPAASLAPSRTLHVRNLPAEVQEADLRALAEPFGALRSVSLLRGKHQAFLQLADLPAAAGLLAYYAAHPAQLRYGRASQSTWMFPNCCSLLVLGSSVPRSPQGQGTADLLPVQQS